MDELISRKAAIDYIKGHIYEIITESGIDKNEHTNKVLRAIITGVETMPSVKPQYTEAEIQKMQELEQAEIEKAYELGKAERQKVGSWIDGGRVITYTYKDSGVWARAYTFICSECKEENGKKTKFCPNCGCHMVEPQESEE